MKDIERYQHTDKERLNNPEVGLVSPKTDPERGQTLSQYQYDPHLDPQLQWAGKAEQTNVEVPNLSLHVHERLDPQTILEAVRSRQSKAADSQPSLWEQEQRPLREAMDFYKHQNGWTNRLVAGDSLLVMNSLLQKENMAGKVQMLYFDPPYGIKYGSNFQPFTDKRDVKDRNDEDLTQEPEMLKAFRDTWQLGIHSYLSYLRDRLLLARELLHESGSVFVQISDENVHRVRMIMDEVFGAENFVSLITFKKTGGFASSSLSNIADYILFYAKKKDSLKFNQLFEEKVLGEGSGDRYSSLELPDGNIRPIKKEEFNNPLLLPKGSKPFLGAPLTSDGASKEVVKFEFEGKSYRPKSNQHWKTTLEGMNKLARAGRIFSTRTFINYKLYLSDFPAKPISNLWTDTMGTAERNKSYVVQTTSKIIQRCLLMTTDPGDLVLDITCGSGTTAYVAEQWGRRWLTCDTSRVALTLAKQRLLTAQFDYYQLARPQEGIGGGLVYKTVPHITLKSIANDEPPATETLYDQPKIDRKKVRVTGPFTVESVPAPVVTPVGAPAPVPATNDQSNARSGQTARLSQWRDELLRTGVRGKGGRHIEFARLEALSGTRYLHARGETKEGQRVGVVFGPEHAPLEPRLVQDGIDEARQLQPEMLLFCAFQFTDEATKDIDQTNPDLLGFTLLKAHMNMDLQTDDLKKASKHNQSFWLIGQPDVEINSEEWLAVGGQQNAIQTLGHYECCKKFSGLGSLAEIQSLSREDLSFYLALSQERDLWDDLTDAKGSRIGSAEHRRGTSEKHAGGVYTVSGDRMRFDGGVGDLDRIIKGLNAAESNGFRNAVERLRRDSKTTKRLASRLEKIDRALPTDLQTLSTIHHTVVVVRGFDYFNPKTGKLTSGGNDDIALWMLDTDYDGRSVFPRQVFFPMSGKKDGWSRLAKNLKSEIDTDKIEAFRGKVSLPFVRGEKVAVKIVDNRGIESMRVF